MLFTARCVFYVSQIELRHLQCMVSVCVCVDMIWGKLPYFREFCLVNCVIYCMSPKMNRAIYSAWLVCVCAWIWSRVTCPISVSFAWSTVLFTGRCVHFMSPKMNRAIYSVWLVCVWECVCVCVCVCACVRACVWSRVDCLVNFLPPKMPCAIYSAQLVCVWDTWLWIWLHWVGTWQLHRQ